MDDDDNLSPQREELQKWLLPLPTLLYCHARYQGVVVSLVSAWRTEAVVKLQDEYGRFEGQIRFYLLKDEQADAQLRSWAEVPAVRRYEHSDLVLWGLCRHTACQAMLAVRNHMKSYTAFKRKKKQADVP
jgi:hypothetical protein